MDDITTWRITFELDRLRKAGVKINAKLLRAFEIDLLQRVTSDEYTLARLYPVSGRLLVDMVTSRWVQILRSATILWEILRLGS